MANKLDFDFATEFLSNPLKGKDAYSWEQFDFLHWRKWMSQRLYIPIALALIYIVLIFYGKRWMAHRSPYRLKSFLILWNVGFATFSFMAFWRTFPDLWSVAQKESSWAEGFYKSVCSSKGLTIQFAYWSWVGVISKALELGDTAFVILRKQKLIFLHWYHHAVTMLYTWYTFPTQEPCHRWLMTVNFFVHTFMYSWYALRAGGIKLPRSSAMLITFVQILQMILGIYVNYYSWRQLNSPRGCERYEFNLIVAAIMYTSYLVLFANFFYQTYLSKSKKEDGKKIE